jgi:asparagine synthase (glutamine-hydrolysing)
MSRWLAIWDPDGNLPPDAGDGAFRVYPWFQPGMLSVLDTSPTFWMGAVSNPNGLPATYQDPSGLQLLWDGAIYRHAGEQEGLSDPALLAAAYRKEARSCLPRFNGRWSFLLHDPDRGGCWLARDRTGVKPLYHWTDGRRRAFASEPKLLLSLPFVDRAFDPEAVFDYFVLNQVDTGKQTLFKDIRQLLPAHEAWFDLKKGQWEERAYYTLPFNPDPERFDPVRAEAFQETIREKLTQAVKRRLAHPAGAPASLLSGGLDSSVLACLVQQESAEPITALTASYREKEFAEQDWAGQVAGHLGARWLQTFPTLEGLRSDLEDFIYSQDTPTFSSGTYSQYCLFRLAGQHGIRSVFDGQGADALFGGHLPHLPPLWRDLFASGQWGRLRKEWRAFGPVWKALAYGGTHWLKYQGIPSMPAALQHGFKRLYFPELRFLNPDILEANRHRYGGGNWQPPSLNQSLWTGYFGGPLSFLLKCVDRASAWAGVETSTPYSDDVELMEAVFAIPGTYKIRHGVRKWLLRESFRDLLPPAVYQRQDKMGLVTPNNLWMAGLRDLAQEYLEEQDDALFRTKALKEAADSFFNPGVPLENYRVYKYLSMLIWRSVFKI